MNARRIIHIPRRFVREEWGGTEAVVLNLNRELIRRGMRSEIWTSKALCEVEQEMLRDVPVRRFDYFYPYFGLSESARHALDKKGGNLFSFDMLRAFRKEPDIDLIHLHTGKRLGSIGRSEALRRRIPYVVSVHGGVLATTASETADMLNPTRGTLEWGKILGAWFGSRRVFDDASAIHCVNAEEAETFREKYPRVPVFHIPNGVDTRAIQSGDGARFRARRNIPPDALLIGSIARIDPQKDQMMLLKAFEIISRKHPQAHLLIAGPETNSGYAEKMRNQIQSHPARNRIHCPGALDALSGETADAFRALDIFALTSSHEPFGIVILEAWAAGAAVVATAVGGVPSFTEHGQDALHSKAGDAEDFAGKLDRLLSDPALRDRLANAGQQKAQRDYSWDAVTNQFVEMYDTARKRVADSRGKRVS